MLVDKNYKDYSVEIENSQYNDWSGYIKTSKTSPWPELLVTDLRGRWISAELVTSQKAHDWTTKSLQNIKNLTEKEAAKELIKNRLENNKEITFNSIDKQYFSKSDHKEYLDYSSSRQKPLKSKITNKKRGMSM